MAPRYESDRTFKDKIELEKEKLSQMNFRQKLGYIWDYYKPVLAGIVALFCCIGIGVEIYHNMKTIDLLNIGAINSFKEDGAVGIEAELLEILGTGDSYEEVNIDCNYGFGNSMEEADYNILTKFTTIIMSHDMDVLVCPDWVYEYYKEDTFMTDLSTLFTSEECEKYGIEPGARYLDISEVPIYQDYMLTQYKPVYLIVIEGCKNPDNAARFIKYIKGGTING